MGGFGEYLFELDGVVIWVCLIGDLVCSLVGIGGWMFDLSIVWIIVDVVFDILFGVVFWVIECFLFDVKMFKKEFVVCGIGSFEIKKCGVDVDLVVFCMWLLFWGEGSVIFVLIWIVGVWVVFFVERILLSLG